MGDERFPVRLGYNSPGGGTLPHWAASRLGIFERNGLDVGITLIPGTVANVDALLSGEIQFANIPAFAVVDANVTDPDADLVYLGSGRVTVAQQYMATPEVAGLEDLRGKRIAVRVRPSDRFGELDTALWRIALARVGLDPETDVEFVPASTHEDLVEALSDGRADAMTVVPPLSFEAERRGFKVILDGRLVEEPWQLGGLVTRRSFAEEHPEVIERYARSYVEGLSAVMSDVPMAEDLVRDYGGMRDDWIAARTIDFYIGAFTWPPFPTLEGLGNVIAELAQRRPEASKLRPEDCVHIGALEKLDREGFIAAHEPPPHTPRF